MRSKANLGSFGVTTHDGSDSATSFFPMAEFKSLVIDTKSNTKNTNYKNYEIDFNS